MKVHVKQSLKTDVASALKLCTDQKSQEAMYAKLPGSNVRIKREGKAPNVRLRVSRTMPANPPAAIKRLVPATNEVSHTEAWRADGNGHVADIAVEIKGVPVKITGTKALRPRRAAAASSGPSTSRAVCRSSAASSPRSRARSSRRTLRTSTRS